MAHAATAAVDHSSADADIAECPSVTALGHAGTEAVFDPSSADADIAECPPVTALSHAGPAAAEDHPAAITIEPPVPNQTVALTSNALDAFLDKRA